jgi:methyl-accepting chemotaxis protein
MSHLFPPTPSDTSPRPFSRRKRLLSRPADQFRTSLVPTLGAAVLLVLLLATVHQINATRTSELMQANPAFSEALEAQALGIETTVAIGAVFYLFGLLIVGLVHSRLLMGALFAMHRRIRALAEGDLSGGFRLRRGDYFHDVAESINEAASAFRNQAREDLADVDDLIAVLDRSPYAGPLRDGLHETLEGVRSRKLVLLGRVQERAGKGAGKVVEPAETTVAV